MTLSHIFGLSLALFFVRLIGFVVCLPTNFNNIWKPGALEYFSPIIYGLLAVLGIITLIIFIKKIGNSTNKIKNYYFIYSVYIYLAYLLFNRNIIKGCFDYLFFLNVAESPLEVILPNLILDLFFEPPYIVFGLLFIGIIYWFCKKYNHIEYSFLFWIIPFYFYNYYFDDLVVSCLIGYLIISLLGMRYSDGKSSLPILSILLFVFLICIGYSYKFSKFDQLNLKLVFETIAIFFVPAFILCLLCKNSKDSGNIALTWILPPVTMFFLYLPLSRLSTGYCFVALINFCITYIVVANIFVLLPLLFLFTFILEKLIKNAGKILFYIISIIMIGFSILDSALFFYSQFRINYQTIAWTNAMNDVVRTTLATCLSYLTPSSLTVIISTFLIGIIILFKSRSLLKHNKTFRFNYFLILFISHISIALLQMDKSIPEILKEPTFELIKSLPLNKIFKKSLSKEIIVKGFKECGIPLKKITEKNNNSSNNLDKINVILITLESVHWRYVNIFGKDPKTWPMMGHLKDRMEIFPFIYSCFPESTCGDFAMLASLIPYDYLHLQKNYSLNYKTIFNELKKSEYNTYFFSSTVSESGLNNIVKTQPFDYKFVFTSNDSNKDNSWEWGYKEEYTIDKILDFLKNRKSSNPYILWYRMIYPHAPFPKLDLDVKPIFQEKDEYNMLTLVSKYKNALTYLDKTLYKLINEITILDSNNNQKTLIVMVGDHGEKLAEKEYNETTSHGLHTTPELQNVVCIFIKPESKGLEINKNYGSQIDILPTILDYLKIEPSVERYEQGYSLYRNDLASRPVYLSSVESYALIENGYFFEFRDKNSPNFKITKLEFDDTELKSIYKSLPNWPDHKDIYEKYQKVKKFYRIQEDFLNQL